MKNFKTLLLIAVVTLGFNTMQAQSKIAHIDTQSLILVMSETKAMTTELEKLGKTYDDELKKAEEELKAKAAKYQSEAQTQTPEENQKRQIEIQTNEQKLYAAAKSAQQALENKRNELLQPIMKLVQETIDAVATEQGFDYVMDKSALIVAKGTDILPLVKAKMNITE